MKKRFNITSCKIDVLKVIQPTVFSDERGCFVKYYEKDIFKELGLDIEIQEVFESFSYKNVIRGMHFQTKEPQGKLVRAVQGEIIDIAVDLRKNSDTFGKCESVLLSSDNNKLFWIPAGFAHGFVVKSESAIVSYTCVGKYLGEYDTGIRWNDIDLNINWNIDNPIISDKDKNLMTLKEFREKYQGL